MQHVHTIDKLRLRPYFAKVTKHGSSLHVVVPSYIRDFYDVQVGDYFEVTLTPVRPCRDSNPGQLMLVEAVA